MTLHIVSNIPIPLYAIQSQTIKLPNPHFTDSIICRAFIAQFYFLQIVSTLLLFIDGFIVYKKTILSNKISEMFRSH